MHACIRNKRVFYSILFFSCLYIPFFFFVSCTCFTYHIHIFFTCVCRAWCGLASRPADLRRSASGRVGLPWLLAIGCLGYCRFWTSAMDDRTRFGIESEDFIHTKVGFGQPISLPG